MRSDEKSTVLFNEAKKIGFLKKQRQLTEPNIFKNYKVLQFEILDNIIFQLTERFKDFNKLKFVSLVDSSKFKLNQFSQ